MIIQLLVNIAADNPAFADSLCNSLVEDIHTLASDALKSAFRATEFKFQSDVIALAPGVSLGAQSQTIVQLIADEPLLTKADLTRRFTVTMRTLERWIVDGKLPSAVRLRGGPRWRPSDIAQFEATNECG